ncbi:MAG TPA: hypothetical protein VL463_17210 [Kofleriaceae bacterium]|jgi:hypothetical protein|nr:hypothetical protein [Kofleriaceae bacterium]
MKQLAWLALAVVIACGNKDKTAPAPAKDPAPAPAPAPVSIDAAPAFPTPPGIPTFEESLRRGGMTFTMPAGFTRIAPVDNSQWKYAFAMRSDKPAFEVWIRIDPLDEALAEAAKCKADPSCHGTDPNQRGPMWLAVIAANLGGAQGGLPDVKELDPAKVKQDFNADWGGFASVAPSPELTTKFPRLLVVALHKDDKADAVIAIAAGDDLTPDDLYRALDGFKFAP